MSTAGGSLKVILFAFFSNLAIALAKFAAALISGSASMLAEAIHSLVDTSNQVLLMVGSHKAKKPPSESHPLGYGREAFFWSFVVAILLFSLGGLFAIYEGIHKISSPNEVGSPVVGLIVLVISFVIEGFSFRACIKEVKKQPSFNGLLNWFRSTTASELLVVFTEDAAAMIGLGVASLCLFSSWLTGNPIWDAVGSILVGSILVVVACLLAAEIKSLLIGEATTTDFRAYFERSIPEYIPNGKLLKLIALQVGADEVMLSIKLSPGSLQDVNQLIDRINQLEVETKKKFPEVRWQFVEPDFFE